MASRYTKACTSPVVVGVDNYRSRPSLDLNLITAVCTVIDSNYDVNIACVPCVLREQRVVQATVTAFFPAKSALPVIAQRQC